MRVRSFAIFSCWGYFSVPVALAILKHSDEWVVKRRNNPYVLWEGIQNPGKTARYIYPSNMKLDTQELKHVGGNLDGWCTCGEAVDGVFHEPFMKEYGTGSERSNSSRASLSFS